MFREWLWVSEVLFVLYDVKDIVNHGVQSSVFLWLGRSLLVLAASSVCSTWRRRRGIPVVHPLIKFFGIVWIGNCLLSLVILVSEVIHYIEAFHQVSVIIFLFVQFLREKSFMGSVIIHQCI